MSVHAMVDTPAIPADFGLVPPDTLPASRRYMPESPDTPVIATPAPAATRLTPGGFEMLLGEVLSPAYGYALRLTRNRADAEDLVQEAALRAFRFADGFEAGTNFKAWFFRILVRQFWARRRRQKDRVTTVDLDDTPDLYLYARSAAAGIHGEPDDPAGELMDRLGTERIVAAIAELPDEYGVVCTLYFMEDFAYHEIAQILDVPVGTVRSRLHRGRKMLQKTLWQLAEEAGIVAELSAKESDA